MVAPDGPTTTVMPRTGKGAEAASVQGRDVPFEWATVREAFASGHHLSWLTTVSPHGIPHVVPVFAAWDGDRCYVATNAQARKTRDLAGTGRCVLATDLGHAHAVVEASAARLTEPDAVERAATVFRERYGWPVTRVGEVLDAPFAAPTSGGAPFQVWELTPAKAFGFPADGESNAPTRWTFAD